MKAADTSIVDTVARLLPPSPDRDEILELVQLGARFKAQQTGRKPGALAHLVADYARRIGPPYRFDRLLAEMAFDARRRTLLGRNVSPIAEVDRSCDLVTICLPGRGEMDIPFGTLRNHLTKAKRLLPPIIPRCA